MWNWFSPEFERFLFQPWFKIWGLRNDSMAFQCKQLSILEGILKFAVRNCEKRRLIFAVLPDIDLAKIILFCLFVFSLG